MKKLLLTFLFCMIGFNAFALELMCKYIENEYVKRLDENNRVLSTTKAEGKRDYFRVNILKDKCVRIEKSLAERIMKIRKSDARYKCRFDNSEGDKSFHYTNIIRIDRYSGEAEEIFWNKDTEIKNIYQCEKSEKKF